MQRLFAFLALVGVIISIAYPRSAPLPPPGVSIDYQPHQTEPESTEKWKVENYVFTPLANFEIDARVLLRARYYFDQGASLSPLDLTLGWGPMSDTTTIEKIRLSHGHRYYSYRIQDRALDLKTVAHNSANMHLIPANDSVKSALLKVRPNEFISIKGKLVAIRSASGFTWRSSLTRKDTGMGACEVIWVDEVFYIDP